FCAFFFLPRAPLLPARRPPPLSAQPSPGSFGVGDASRLRVPPRDQPRRSPLKRFTRTRGVGGRAHPLLQHPDSAHSPDSLVRELLAGDWRRDDSRPRAVVCVTDGHPAAPPPSCLVERRGAEARLVSTRAGALACVGRPRPSPPGRLCRLATPPLPRAPRP